MRVAALNGAEAMLVVTSLQIVRDANVKRAVETLKHVDPICFHALLCGNRRGSARLRAERLALRRFRVGGQAARGATEGHPERTTA